MLQELDDFYEYYGAQTDKGAEAVVCAISDVLSLFPNHVAPAAQWTCLGIKTLNNIYHDKTLKNTARLQWMTNSENLNFDDPNFVTVDGVWDPNTETYLFYTDTIPQEQLFDGSITVSFISESNEVPIYEFISYDPNFTEIGNKHLALDNISPYGDINGDGTLQSWQITTMNLAATLTGEKEQILTETNTSTTKTCLFSPKTGSGKRVGTVNRPLSCNTAKPVVYP